MLERSNDNGNKWQAIVTGRELSVQANESRLRKQQQILHILPYRLTDRKKKKYQDASNLLEIDQRNLWWQKFGQAKGKSYKKIPHELSTKHFHPITREPLLNYLLALSYERQGVEFNNKISLNNIYYDLLKAVYERQYEGYQHSASNHLGFEDFLEILEEIALTVWHGNGRTASDSELFKRCKEAELTRHLETFSEGAKKGVVRLMTAFYFRKFSTQSNGDLTFEFTHKTFGEYLTARRIVDTVENISEERERHKQSSRKGWTPQKALEEWIKVTGPTTMDFYLFRFIKDEIAMRDINLLQKWQRIFGELLGIVVRDGSPMEQIGLPNFATMLRHSRNAEESLLVIHYSCAVITQEELKIDWGQKFSFGAWLKRIQGQQTSAENPIALRSLGYLNLAQQTFFAANLHKADFSDANLEKTNLSKGNFENAIFVRANLTNAHLTEAHFEKAHFKGAALKGANFKGAFLRGTHFRGANLEGVSLERADLRTANLDGVNLEGVSLHRANLRGANLNRANLEEAKLVGADLDGANLEEANLKGTILEETVTKQPAIKSGAGAVVEVPA